MSKKKISMNVDAKLVEKLYSIANKEDMSLTEVCEMFLSFSEEEYSAEKMQFYRQAPIILKKK